MGKDLISCSRIITAALARGTGLGLLALVVLLLIAPGSAGAAAKTWDGGCGGDTSWSCANNWKGDVVPAATDTVLFKGTSTHNSTVDPGFAGTVAAIKINPGYTGTVSLGRSLVVSKSLVQMDGGFDAGGQDLAMKALTLSGGVFTASSGTTSVAGQLKVSGTPSFKANGGTVEFGGVSATLSCGGIAFNQVLFSHASGTKTVGSECKLPLGTDPSADSGGSIKLDGTMSGAGTLATSGKLTLGASGKLSGFSGLSTGALEVKGAFDFGAYSTFSVANAFTLTSGAGFVAPSATASFAANFTISNGATFAANGGTASFVGTAGSTLSCGNKVFSHVTLATSMGVKTVGPNCSLPLGNNPTLLGESSGATVKLEGVLSGTGTLTAQRTLVMSGTASLSGFSGLVAQNNLTMSGAGANFGSYGPFSVEGNYTQTGGTVSAPDGAGIDGRFTLNSGSAFNAPAKGSLAVGGDFTVDSGATFKANGGTVEFDSGSSASITCGSANFNQILFSNFEGTKVVDSSCDLPLGNSPVAGLGGSIALSGTLSGSGPLTTSGTLTLENGGGLSGFSGLSASALTVDGAYDFGSYSPFAVSATFTLEPGADITAPAGSASLGGDFVSEPEASFDANGGTVELVGTAQSVSGDTTFNNFSKRVSSPDTLMLNAGDTQTVEGALSLEGKDAGDLLSLVSSAPGTPWLIDREGASKVSFVSVSDSTNTGATILAKESIDGGGNTGWIFPGAASELALTATTTTPKAGEADNLTITAKDAYGNTATSYTGSHNLTFGPVADSPSGAHATVSNSSGTATNFGSTTTISFSEGVATVSSGKNGAMTLVKAGATSVTVTDGSITNGSGLAVTVSPLSATSLSLAATTTTPKAGEADNLTITAKDAYGNTATSYTGSHNLTFGPVADSPSGAHATVSNSSGTATNFGSTTTISFSEGVATVSSGKNGAMTLVKAGSTAVTVTDGSITNGSGLAVTVSPGAAARLAWTNAKVSKGKLSSPCLFTCAGTEITSSGKFTANVSVTDSSGNTVSALGSGHTVSVTTTTGTITGGSLTIASSGAAESTAQFTFTPPSKGGASTVTAATAGGTSYTSATATMER